jgi:hypothetical protein
MVLALAAITALPLGLSPATALAGGQYRLPTHFGGILNDYTPASVAGGPYEMHGKWSLELNEARGTATFSAEMTMETADFANTDANHDPTKLGPHTHHISVSDGVIHTDPNDPTHWQTACPTLKPPMAGGFVVTGTAYLTGNGSNPSFGNPSPVTICILGGAPSATVVGAQAVVEFSNFTFTFNTGARAISHFGAQAINGVVSQCERLWSPASTDCRVEIVE